MLKISDYLAAVAGFAAVLIFYLVFSGNIVLTGGREPELPVLETSRETDAAGEEAARSDVAEYVVLKGTEDSSNVCQQITDMLDMLKKEYITEDRVDDLTEKQKEAAKVVIVAAEEPGNIGDWEALLDLAEYDGKAVLFTSVGSAGDDSAVNEETGESLEAEIGIRRRGEPFYVDGMIVMDGILIQGLSYYESMPMKAEALSLDASCTKLIMEKSQTEKEQGDLAPLLWKKTYGKGKLYAVNAPFFKNETGIGIFTGILADMQEVFVYPVVNSSTVLLDHFPEYDQTDEALIRQWYSREVSSYVRDVIWADVAQAASESNLILSGRSGVDRESEEFLELEAQVAKQGGEILNENEGTLLPVIYDRYWSNDRARYRMESAASGMGLASFYLDLLEVMGSKGADAEYEWSAYNSELSGTIYDIFRNNNFLTSRKWSQAEEAYKRYEQIKPEITVLDDQIRIRADGFADVWYCILRMKDKPGAGDGYEATEIGENAYLLEISQAEVTIQRMES